MAIERSVFNIQPPTDEQPGRYLLLVTRNSGMMGGQSSAFAVDRVSPHFTLRGDLRAIQGHVYRVGSGALGADLEEDLVVEFPAGTPYLLVNRRNIRLLTAVEAAQKEKDEHDALEAAFGKGDTSLSVEPPFPGQYA